MRDAPMSDASLPKWLLTEHQRRNQTSLELREIFDQHRQRVMHLLKRVACETAGRLCVLGAGNCNDLKLDELLNAFEKVVLVDIDQTAVASAVARSIPETLRDRIHVAESTDVTGVFEYLQSIDKNDFHATQTNHLLSLLSHQQHIPMAPFDCIASTCLLSELIDSVLLAVSGNHPALAPVILALRPFRTLASLCDQTQGFSTPSRPNVLLAGSARHGWHFLAGRVPQAGGDTIYTHNSIPALKPVFCLACHTAAASWSPSFR